MSAAVSSSLNVDVCYIFLEYCDKPSLNALVRASRFFFDIAVKFLWADVTGIKPLLCCFPDQLFSVDGETTSFKAGPLPPDVRERMRIYTTSVIRFESAPHEEHLGLPIDDACYNSILDCTEVQLFPRLRHLVIREALGVGYRQFLGELLCKRNVSRVSIAVRDKVQLDDIRARLDSCATHELKALAITLHPELELPSTLFQTVARFANLEELELAYNEPPRHEGEDMPPLISRIPPQVFSPDPILALSKITHFTLKGPFEIAPSDIEKIAQAWPRLRSLELRTQARHYDTPRSHDLAVRDLVPLVAYCKELVELVVCLRSTMIFSGHGEPRKHVYDAVGQSSDNLRVFSSVGLGQAVLSSDDKMLLRHMFPKAQIRGVGNVEDDPEAQMWLALHGVLFSYAGAPA